MLRVEWSLLTQLYSVDRDSNSVSLFNIIDQVTIPNEVEDPKPEQVTAIGPSFALVQCWSRDESEEPKLHTARLSLFVPSGTVVGGGEFDVDLQVTSRTRTFVKVPFLPYSGTGTYRFVVELSTANTWVQVAEILLPVDRPPSVEVVRKIGVDTPPKD